MEHIEPKQEMKRESPKIPEVLGHDWETLILLQRHGGYDNRRPADPEHITEEEKKTLGRLTPEGIEEVKRRTHMRLEAIFQQSSDVDFLLINSPTFWLDNENFGQRARETAETIAGEIAKELEKRGLPETQLLNLTTREGKPAFKGGVSRPEIRLGEALMFQFPEFTAFLRKESGGKQGPEFWKNFNEDTYKEERKKAGAEGPVEIADRMNEFLTVVARFAAWYHEKHPGRKLVPWIVTHGDSVEPYVQRVVGGKDFTAGFGDGVGISVDSSGRARSEVNGIEYNVPFVEHGKPAPLQSDTQE